MKFNDEQIKYIINQYGKIPYKNIANNIGLSINQIQSIVYKYIPKENRYDRGKSKFSYRPQRIYNVDDTIFDIKNINTESCYWAGLLAADGNIEKNKEKQLTISLQISDVEHLEQFNSFVKCENKVHIGKSKYTYKGVLKYAEYCCVRFTSEKICYDLKHNFNITEQKSLTLKPPPLINNDFIDAFIIGLIDGDGSIGLYKAQRQDGLQISLSGTKEICEWVKNRFDIIINKEINCVNKRGNKNLYTLVICDKNARLIVQHLSKIQVPRLERKWTNNIIYHSYNFVKFRNKSRYIEILKLSRSGLNQSYISKILGITPAAISWYMKQDLYKQLDTGETNLDEDENA